MLLRFEYLRMPVVDKDSYTFEFYTAFGMRIIGSFFCWPVAMSSDMVHIIRLAFDFQDPHRYGGIS